MKKVCKNNNNNLKNEAHDKERNAKRDKFIP